MDPATTVDTSVGERVDAESAAEFVAAEECNVSSNQRYLPLRTMASMVMESLNL